MKLTLIYFNIPFWRAEIIRLALFIGDIEFEDRRITGEEFQRVKVKGELDDGTKIPFHQFPCFLVNGTSLAQTGGIARFCGKLSGLYPKNDGLLCAQIDQFIDICTDINVLISTTAKIDNDDLRIRRRKELFDGDLSRKLAILDKNIRGDYDWICGSGVGLTIADLAVWRLIGWVSSGMLDGIPTTFLEDFPNIRRICHSVENTQKVQEWIKTTYPKNYLRGNY
jgi:prostaglandin-H2 D-isomerase / glutathione transferase